jgi:hypothetical protein
MTTPRKRELVIAGPARPQEPNAWKITRNGDVVAYDDTQKQVVATAVLLCNKRWKEQGILSELQIRRRDGTVRDARTYGKDPRGIKG